jgi:hypothetical protein
VKSEEGGLVREPERAETDTMPLVLWNKGKSERSPLEPRIVERTGCSDSVGVRCDRNAQGALASVKIPKTYIPFHTSTDIGVVANISGVPLVSSGTWLFTVENPFLPRGDGAAAIRQARWRSRRTY